MPFFSMRLVKLNVPQPTSIKHRSMVSDQISNLFWLFFILFSLQKLVRYWMKSARDEKNYRLQYDLPHTWSQKYNLVYQNILSLNLFPPEVAKVESDYYQTKMLDFGIPLDSRSNLTKGDWTAWTAAFSNSEQATSIFDKVYKFANESSDRMPLTDLYNVANGHTIAFRARPVMGGLFARALLLSPLVHNLDPKAKSTSKRYGRENKCNVH